MPATPKIFQLHVGLAEIEPLIWRRLEVAGNMTLSTLHSVLQDVMGWDDSHLYLFRVDGQDYQEPDPEAEGKDARRAHLDHFDLKAGDTFEYIYDLGDYWRHELRVEAITPARVGETYPHCLAGARACPPDDCGGISGYIEVLKAVADRTRPDARVLLESIMPGFDPEAFDLRATNRALRLARSRHPVE